MPMDDGARLLEKVARLYYKDDLTQQEIAGQLGMSRPKVARLLKQAKERGIVKIEIVSALALSGLERTLERRFGLKEAVVVRVDGSNEALVRREIGAAAANCFLRVVNEGDTVAVSWGRTLFELVGSLRPQHVRARIVQMVGGFGRIDINIHASELARRIAERLDGSYMPLHAPAIVQSAMLHRAMMEDVHVREVMEAARQARVALVGVGTPDQHSVLVESGYLSTEEMEEIKREAAGDICAQFFTAQGQVCDSHFHHQRVVGLPLADLQRIEYVLAAAGGVSKAGAILGALRGRLANILITDEDTAEAVLKLDEVEM